jgi:hypothetical protein
VWGHCDYGDTPGRVGFDQEGKSLDEVDGGDGGLD